MAPIRALLLHFKGFEGFMSNNVLRQRIGFDSKVFAKKSIFWGGRDGRAYPRIFFGVFASGLLFPALSKRWLAATPGEDGVEVRGEGVSYESKQILARRRS